MADTKSEKLVLIDGHSILNRAFYGMPDLTNSKGVHTGAVYGFLNILFKILEEEQADYLTVAFDVHAPTFRHEYYADYKGTRHAMPDELREQVPLIKEVLAAMGVAMREQAGLEADDILGTLAREAESGGMEVSLVSGDRDLLQIATERTRIRIPKTRMGQTTIENYYAQDVEAAYGVTPRQFIDVKALMGDSSDNIPGVPKVGEKTAVALIQQYGSVDGVYEHLDEITKKALHQNLADNEDKARMSLFLATIKTDCDIELDREEARIHDFYTHEAFELFTELNFKNFLPRFSAAAIAGTAAGEDAEADGGAGSGRKGYSCRISRDYEEAARLLIPAEGGIGLVPVYDEVPLGLPTVMLGLAVSTKEECAYFPAEDEAQSAALTGLLAGLRKSLREKNRGAGAGTSDTAQAMIGPEPYFAAGAYLQHQFGLWGIESGEFRDGIDLSGLQDLLLIAYLVNPLKSDYEAEDVISEYLGESIQGEKAFLAKKSFAEVLSEMGGEERVAEYACRTADGLRRAAPPAAKELQERGMWQLFTQMERPLSFILYDMQRIGIRIVPEELKAYGDRLTGRIEELTESIHRAAGHPFNIASPKQLGEVLFDEMKLPGGKKTKTGYSTSADVLQKLEPEVPFVSEVLEYRALTKLKSTYADGLAAFIAPDSRIHTTFHQTITATGRISSTDPNLQNIPMKTELGKAIRKCFIPKDGCLFTDADYSQIELRILAHMSGDEELIDAYMQDEDIHRITASKVFHTPFEEVTPLQRRNAKAVNFGIIYGQTSFGLSQGLSISRKEAAEYIEQYFATYPGVKAFLDGLVASAKEKGYAETMYGRRRPIPELKNSNFMQRQFGERVAMNSPIQGSAADIMKLAMIRVWEELEKRQLQSRLILQIHDELLVETAPGEEQEVHELLVEGMKGAAQLKVALEVDCHEGRDWFGSK